MTQRDHHRSVFIVLSLFLFLVSVWMVVLVMKSMNTPVQPVVTGDQRPRVEVVITVPAPMIVFPTPTPTIPYIPQAIRLPTPTPVPWPYCWDASPGQVCMPSNVITPQPTRTIPPCSSGQTSFMPGGVSVCEYDHYEQYDPSAATPGAVYVIAHTPTPTPTPTPYPTCSIDLPSGTRCVA